MFFQQLLRSLPPVHQLRQNICYVAVVLFWYQVHAGRLVQLGAPWTVFWGVPPIHGGWVWPLFFGQPVRLLGSMNRLVVGVVTCSLVWWFDGLSLSLQVCGGTQLLGGLFNI